MKSVEACINESVLEAQKSAKNSGLKIGSIIAHQDDKFTYLLVEIRGNVAVGKIPAAFSKTGEEIIKEFPLDEIFDPKKVRSIALKKAAARIMQP